MDRSALEAALSAALEKQEDTQKRLDEALLEIALLKDMLRLKSRLAFIPSTEQFSLLFDESEVLSEDLTDEQEAMIEIPAHERRKQKKHDLTTLPADTPVQEVYHYDDEQQKFCDRCASALVAKEDRVVYQVEVVPKSYTILAHHYRSWVCSSCEADEGEQNIITEWENKETDTLIASSSLVAECAVRKYADGLPLYRQEAIFRREGLQFSRQTISNWLLTYMGLLTPLRRQFEKHIQSSPLINQDETPVKVIHLPEPEASKSTFMFVQVGTDDERSLVLYSYIRNRKKDTLASFTKDFRGYVMTDGLKGYLGIEHHLNCWVHAQRGFKNIVKVNKKASGALKYISLINRLFQIEKDARRLYADRDQFLTERRKLASAVFEDLRRLMDETRAQYASRSPMGTAITYLYTYWDSLIRYVECFEATPENNIAENAIRPFVLGRKAWLFSNTESGAEASAFYYSMVETAKLNGVNVADYLWYCLDEAPRCKTDSDWEKLLPWNMDTIKIAELKKRRASALPDAMRTEPYVLRGAH
ncbi:MAG: IS66 family transposase [Sphaerochaetaceae bacterium]|nr:IS66 family transposase [Sphaerochaetaceae bacterium]